MLGVCENANRSGRAWDRASNAVQRAFPRKPRLSAGVGRHPEKCVGGAELRF